LQGLIQSSNLILPEYGLYYLSFELQRLKFEGRGTTISGITKKQLKDTSFPLPPYNEQRRIVAKIEELFSELDKGIENIKAAKEQLKVYRQAVLSHAFQGKLTEQWREENRDRLQTADDLLAGIKGEREARYQQQLDQWKVAVKKWEADAKPGKKPSKPRAPKPLSKLTDEELDELPPLPGVWIWDKLGWMTCGVEYGTSAKSSESGKVPVLRMGNIQIAKFDYTDLVFTSDEEEIAKYSLRDGDVLFNRTNSPELVGKTAIYRGEQPAIFAGYLIRVNQIESVVDAQYLNLFLNSHIAKQQGNKVSELKLISSKFQP
jgi:type I restriction enzyme S subunit